MTEILLALEREDLTKAKNLGPNIIGRLGGIMIDPEMQFRFESTDGSAADCSFVKTVVFARVQLGVDLVLLDSRLSQDKTSKMREDVLHFLHQGPKKQPKKQDGVSHFFNQEHIDDRLVNRYKPSHLTVNYYANRSSMLEFMDACKQDDVTPVCFMTSSRSEEIDYKDRNTTATEFAKRSAEVVSELGFSAVLIAAVDAPVVKKVNPELKTIVTGAILQVDEPTNHSRPGLISETAHATDFSIFGSAVFGAEDPAEAFEARQLEYLLHT